MKLLFCGYFSLLILWPVRWIRPAYWYKGSTFLLFVLITTIMLNGIHTYKLMYLLYGGYVAHVPMYIIRKCRFVCDLSCWIHVYLCAWFESMLYSAFVCLFVVIIIFIFAHVEMQCQNIVFVFVMKDTCFSK